MNKTEFINAVAEATGQTKKLSDEIAMAAFDVIVDALARGEEVSVKGFGKFEVIECAARTGHNPRTGESLEIPAHGSVKFRPAKALKEAVY